MPERNRRIPGRLKLRTQALPGHRVAAAYIDGDRFDKTLRYELGVEALCELASEITVGLASSDRLRGPDALASFVHRYWGISYASRGEHVPPSAFGTAARMRTTALLWLCLERILELTDHLGRHAGGAQWRQFHEIIHAWRDSWGDDGRARIAQARFSTLTGLTREGEARVEYMHSALVKALSIVGA
jgi:hypothetical protein